MSAVVPPRTPLILTPTPLHRLDRLSERLGGEIWIKRDDLTGFALGGNKGRKIEYLIAEALAQKASVIVTCGALQSNFIRQIGVAARMHGIRCRAVVMAVPYEDFLPQGQRLRSTGGNETLDQLAGVELEIHPDGNWDTLFALAEAAAVDEESRGETAFRIPVGGSSAQGAYAFLQAAKEVAAQAEPFDWIVTACSSGSTLTGLTYFFHGSPTKVLGMASDPEPEMIHEFAELAGKLSDLLEDPPKLTAEDFRLNVDYVGPGYEIPSEEGDAASQLLLETEGIFLDPIYSGKAFAGFLALFAKKDISGRILFWHTGGIPALFAR